MTDTFPTKPTLSQGESPSLYKNDAEDKTIKSDTDGGYEFRRNRFTRTRRRQIQTGFISLPHIDYLALNAFWETHTTVAPFVYFDYIHGVNRTVRFDEFKPVYVGIGTTKLWTITIKMSEV